MPRKTAVALICVLLSLLLTGCASAEPISRQEFLFDTVIKITVYDKPDELLLDGAMELCRHYESLFSRTIENSDVWRINHADGQPVEVDADTARLLSLSLDYSRMSSGLFDVTIFPLSSLWDFTGETAALPEQAKLEEALTHVGWEKVSVNGNVIQLESGMGIDLGGIAKGYIADRLRDYLRESGVNSALINLGGNVLTLGTKPEGQDFLIGVQKPFGDASQLLGAVKGHDVSVVTSGVYERYFELDGKRYHHILSPSDGYPVQNDLFSVTIISADSTPGDALSTVCFAMGEDAGMALIESLEGIEAVFARDDGTLAFSSGAKACWLTPDDI